MKEREFNLIDEPWIRVIRPDCTAEEVNLRDVLLHAHAYHDLNGELPTQDVAILRLLLAVLHTVFTRVDEDGNDAPFEDPEDALVRWDALWQLGHFPEAPIRAYLEKWRERFYLFHPERPFYQVHEAGIGTENKAYKLNGELSQSNNKERLFPMCAGENKERMGYPEAARWLIYLNAYDDTSGKPKGKGLPVPGIGWLGKLGLITAVGGNLFETLMLNLVLWPRNRSLWDEPELPCWELAAPRRGERVQIAMPRNAASLLTLQSRRILLRRERDSVVGYTLLGGDFFPKEDALLEQMTVWTDVRDKNGNHQHFQPRRHSKTKQMWRDFGAIAGVREGQRRPGVVEWASTLCFIGLLPGMNQISFRIASVQYGDSDYFVNHVFGDQLTFHTQLLCDAGARGYEYAMEEIERCEKAAQAVGRLARSLYIAAGGRGTSREDAVKAQYFDRIDAPFRLWLAELNPDETNEQLEARCAAWRVTARQTALALGQSMIDEAGDQAFIGRSVEDKKGKKGKKDEKAEKRHFSAPEAYRWFLNAIYKLYPRTEESTGGEQS